MRQLEENVQLARAFTPLNETQMSALAQRTEPIERVATERAPGEPALYAPHAKGRRVAVVTNSVVQPLYLARVQAAIEAAGAEM